MGRTLPLLLILAGLTAPAPAEAAFPGQNGKIAFHVFSDGGNADIYTIERDGSGAANLTSGNPEFDAQAAWSPDGRKIAFASSRGGSLDLYVMNADGSAPTKIPNTSGATEPAWSPDGTKIAFTADEPDIFVINIDGSGKANLTGPDGVFNSLPAWSPNGATIAFVQNPSYPSGDFDVHTMNPDGTGRTSITTGTADDYSPDWAPDGARLAFNRDPSAFASLVDVWTMSPEGSSQTRITTDQAGNVQPAWSPDGSRIAFAKGVGGMHHVFTMNPDGSGRVDVTGGLGHALGPDWQPIGPNQPPDCAQVRATPQALGAPNHRLVTVTLSGATDPDGDAVDLEITGVTQDEPVTGPPDAVATAVPHRVRLRAERDPHGDGRVYRIAFEASDGRGGACTGTAVASLRKGSRPAIDSAPPSYDSFGS